VIKKNLKIERIFKKLHSAGLELVVLPVIRCMGANHREPGEELLTPLLSRDVATKTVVLIAVTVQAVGEDFSPSWRPKLVELVHLTRLEGDGRDSIVDHVGGCSIPVEWYSFQFFKK